MTRADRIIERNLRIATFNVALCVVLLTAKLLTIVL